MFMATRQLAKMAHARNCVVTRQLTVFLRPYFLALDVDLLQQFSCLFCVQQQ